MKEVIHHEPMDYDADDCTVAICGVVLVPETTISPGTERRYINSRDIDWPWRVCKNCVRIARARIVHTQGGEK